VNPEVRLKADATGAIDKNVSKPDRGWRWTGAPLGAEPSPVTRVYARAPSGAGQRQDPRVIRVLKPLVIANREALLLSPDAELITGASGTAVGHDDLDNFFALHLPALLVLQRGDDLPRLRVDHFAG
jgi:hypothetical protein